MFIFSLSAFLKGQYVGQDLLVFYVRDVNVVGHPPVGAGEGGMD